MENKDQPAYPIMGEASGLTKREAFALAAMQGLICETIELSAHDVLKYLGLDINIPYDLKYWHQYLAKRSVEIADATLSALETKEINR